MILPHFQTHRGRRENHSLVVQEALPPCGIAENDELVVGIQGRVADFMGDGDGFVVAVHIDGGIGGEEGGRNEVQFEYLEEGTEHLS